MKDANKSQRIFEKFYCFPVLTHNEIVIAVVNFVDDIDERDNEPPTPVACQMWILTARNDIDLTPNSLRRFQFSVSYSVDGILCMHLIWLDEIGKKANNKLNRHNIAIISHHLKRDARDAS